MACPARENVSILLGLAIIALAFMTGSGAVVLLAILPVILALVTVGMLSSTLSGIYSTAVCRNAVDGETGGFSALS